MVEEKCAEDESKGKPTRNGKQMQYGFLLYAIIAGLVGPVRVTLIASLEVERVDFFDSLGK